MLQVIDTIGAIDRKSDVSALEWVMPDAGNDLDDSVAVRSDADARDGREGTDHVSPQGSDAAGWVTDWGRLLRIARQVAGLSLNELAQRTGLSKGYLSKLEAGALGAANPSRATLAALARALPSFRPLALTLAPGLGAEELAFEGIAPSVPAVAPVENQLDLAHLRLGWRELEVLAAVLVLEASCLPHPVTAVILARAIDRPVETVRLVLAQLCRAGLTQELPPQSSGQRAEYRVVESAMQRVGAARVGDLLLLATALIGSGAGTATDAPSRPSGSRRLTERRRLDDE
jgi:transcriptional regulator with XRE-family HTH domain